MKQILRKDKSLDTFLRWFGLSNLYLMLLLNLKVIKIPFSCRCWARLFKSMRSGLSVNYDNEVSLIKTQLIKTEFSTIWRIKLLMICLCIGTNSEKENLFITIRSLTLRYITTSKWGLLSHSYFISYGRSHSSIYPRIISKHWRSTN